MTSKPICYAPFIAMYANQYGEFSPCCISKKHRHDDPDSYWTSTELAKMREEMLRGEWPEGCEICQLKAKSGLPNDTEAWDRAYDAINRPPIETPAVRLLDLRTSNLCNLKCRMCGPGSSSQWNDEVSKHDDVRVWHKKIDERIIKDVGYFVGIDLYQIKLLGGEPTIDPMVMQIMEELLSSGRTLPKIRFTTNGTNLNRRFVDLMSRFNEVYVTFSVDAVGDTFEYIRTNANWERVEHNIIDVLEKDSFHHYEFNSILMPYNVFNLVDLLSWYRDLYAKGYRFRVSFDNSESPWTGLEAVLPHHLDQQCRQAESFLDSCDPRFLQDITGISDLVGIMRSVRFIENSHNKFKKFNSTLDRIRGTDITKLSPYLTDYR